MINIVTANRRHYSDFGWLQTYWLFSFADYYDPGNIQYGALRVFNDDVVQPGKGFPTHPHYEMETITIVLDGEITHEDSMGNRAVIQAGDVQRMSAGTGLTHSEFNLAKKPVHFYQIWLYPDMHGLKPSYSQKRYPPSAWKNTLFPVASGQGMEDIVTFHTNATIYRSQLDAGKSVEFPTQDLRRIYVYLGEGSLKINDVAMAPGDRGRIDLETHLHIEALSSASFILIDVPSCKGWGYDQQTLQGARA
ncbi:MAG: pirin family protein [Candidatus Sumerlaeota bacterium]|nr:pirin family protein [Candidatus Sumerlaeota bacterium]